MTRLLSLLIMIMLAWDFTYAAFPVRQEQPAGIASFPFKDKPNKISSKGMHKHSPAIAPDDDVDEGLSAESILSLALPLATLGFFMVSGTLTAPVIAVICGVVGIASILLADHVISSDKKGRGLAMAGYVLGTVGALVAAGIGFYYLLAAIF
jgi:hypothetical protein